MKRVFRIHRFDPQDKTAHSTDEFTLEVRGRDRILDVLLRIREELDGTLAFRHSCAHGVCGSDGFLINGINKLACQTFVEDYDGVIEIAPLRGLPVLKDLVVDMDPFEESIRKVRPWVESTTEGEGLQSPEDFEAIEDMTKCILCACCTTSCPSFWTNPEYLGPAALVAAARFIKDGRNGAAAKVMERVGGLDGVLRCHTVMNCTDACPRDIDVTGAIAAVKAALLRGTPN
ncbi:succinate dehydrogenase iron-sulfur subunit [bacterium]|nr:succinate dehydrogenase iron-sulfur subunit [bacterium]